jgi:hypothetical protein
MSKHRGANIGLLCGRNGLVVIDVDPEGKAAWASMIWEHGEPETLTSTTPRGRHYVFAAEAGVEYVGKMCKGIDVKQGNGYICVEPSIHPEGGTYHWDNWGTKPAPLPDWIAERVAKRKVERAQREGDLSPEETEKVKRCVAHLATQNLSYDEWRMCGMALKDSGIEDGLELWESISELRESQGKTNTLRDCAWKWETFTKEGTTIGSLIKLARDKGIPNDSLGADRLDFALTEEDRKGAAEAAGWHLEGGARIALSPEVVVKAINAAGFAIFEPSGRVVQKVKEDGAIRARFFDDKGFGNIWATHYLRDNDKRIKAIDVWRTHVGRRTYKRIRFTPKAGNGDLNLWGPIPCQGEEGPCDEVLDFIREVIADGDKAKADYLVQWIAHLVQRPEVKSSVVPVIIGLQGSGKGLLTEGFLGAIFGPYYYLIDSTDRILSRFNADQTRRFLTVLDESTWGRNHTVANKLKQLTGSAMMQVEEKFGDTYNIENFSRYIITSNDLDCVRIDEGNRRYLVFETAAPREIAYYGKLWDKIREGSLVRRFFAYLKSLDVSDFNPQSFPASLDVGAEATKVGSLSEISRFLYELVYEKPAKLWSFSAKSGWSVRQEALYQHYLITVVPRYKPSRTYFVKTLERSFRGLVDSKRRWHEGRVWAISPAGIRELIEKALRITPESVPPDSAFTDDKVTYSVGDWG